jgi:hypothetical protein
MMSLTYSVKSGLVLFRGKRMREIVDKNVDKCIRNQKDDLIRLIRLRVWGLVLISF